MRFGFSHPWALALLILVPLWWMWIRRRGRPDGIVYARASTLAAVRSRRAAVLGIVPEVLRALAMAALIISLAGPRTGASVREEVSEGIDIVIALDVSSSMLAKDFRPENRLGAAKQTIAAFTAARPHDRISLVVFASEALTKVPPTTDRDFLVAELDKLRARELGEGTAIGLGLATAANRLRRAPGESRVVILMSDGENNSGGIDPRDAARAAAALGIRVFTIGVGSRTVALIPVGITESGTWRYGLRPVSVDEVLLGDIARITRGRYFRATDTRVLTGIYEEIDRLTRTPVEVRRYVRFTAHYLPFLLLGAALLALEWCFRATRWGRVP
jgi:Ca-activated chloride channel family protein